MTDHSRRTVMGGALALSVTPLACSAPGSSRTGPGQKAPAGVLQPGPRWNGSAGSGGEPQPQSDRPLGQFVPDERFTGGFSAIPGQWIHGAGIRITALGLPPQPADGEAINYFKEAVFYLEGNSVTVTEWSVNPTPVRMHDGTTMPQGSIGFSVEIAAGEGEVTAGDAILYCYLRGEHGLERRIEIPLVINVDRALDAGRTIRYLDPVAGNDNADGSRSAPWRTLCHALSRGGVGDGGKLVLKAGRYFEDANKAAGGPLDNKRAIEVVAEDGARPDQVVITRTTRNVPSIRWMINARLVHFVGVTIDLRQLMQLWGMRDRIIGFFASRLVDSVGPEGRLDADGVPFGYYLVKDMKGGEGDVVVGGFVPPPVLGRVYLAECLFVNFNTQGPALYRNVTALEATDSFAGGPGYDDVVVDGYFAGMVRQGVRRLHLAPDLKLAGARPGSDNTTVLDLVDASDMPALTQIWDLKVRFLNGQLAKSDLVQLVSADPVGRTVVVRGNLAGQIAAGDRIRVQAIWHSDFCQLEGVKRPKQQAMHNTTIFRYRAYSPRAQLFMIQGGVPLEAGSRITTQGTAFTLRSGSGAPNILVEDDLLRLQQEGGPPGEYRIVRSYDSATGKGVLVDAFSRDQADTPVQRSKAMTGFVMALSILHKTGDGYEFGQFQDSTRNFLLVQNSFISQPSCMGFRDKRPAHGHRNHVQMFNLCSALSSESGELPRWGVRVERNHFLRGKPQGREPRVMDGPLSFDANNRYTPFRGQLRIGRKPLIPFDCFGNPVDENSPVGAVSV